MQSNYRREPTTDEVNAFDPHKELNSLEGDRRMNFGLVSVSKKELNGEVTLHITSGLSYAEYESSVSKNAQGVPSIFSSLARIYEKNRQEKESYLILKDPQRLDDLGLALETIVAAQVKTGGKDELIYTEKGHSEKNENTLLATALAAISHGINFDAEKAFDNSFHGEMVTDYYNPGKQRQIGKLEGAERDSRKAAYMAKVNHAKKEFEANKGFHQFGKFLSDSGTLATGAKKFSDSGSFGGLKQSHQAFISAVENFSDYDKTTSAKLAEVDDKAAKAAETADLLAAATNDADRQRITEERKNLADKVAAEVDKDKQDTTADVLNESILHLKNLDFNLISGLLPDGADSGRHAAKLFGPMIERNAAKKILAIKERELLAVIDTANALPDNNPNKKDYLDQAGKLSAQLRNDYQRVTTWCAANGLNGPDFANQAEQASLRIQKAASELELNKLEGKLNDLLKEIDSANKQLKAGNVDSSMAGTPVAKQLDSIKKNYKDLQEDYQRVAKEFEAQGYGGDYLLQQMELADRKIQARLPETRQRNSIVQWWHNLSAPKIIPLTTTGPMAEILRVDDLRAKGLAASRAFDAPINAGSSHIVLAKHFYQLSDMVKGSEVGNKKHMVEHLLNPAMLANPDAFIKTTFNKQFLAHARVLMEQKLLSQELFNALEIKVKEIEALVLELKAAEEKPDEDDRNKATAEIDAKIKQAQKELQEEAAKDAELKRLAEAKEQLEALQKAIRDAKLKAEVDSVQEQIEKIIKEISKLVAQVEAATKAGRIGNQTHKQCLSKLGEANALFRKLEKLKMDPLLSPDDRKKVDAEILKLEDKIRILESNLNVYLDKPPVEIDKNFSSGEIYQKYNEAKQLNKKYASISSNDQGKYGKEEWSIIQKTKESSARDMLAAKVAMEQKIAQILAKPISFEVRLSKEQRKSEGERDQISDLQTIIKDKNDRLKEMGFTEGDRIKADATAKLAIITTKNSLNKKIGGINKDTSKSPLGKAEEKIDLIEAELVKLTSKNSVDAVSFKSYLTAQKKDAIDKMLAEVKTSIDKSFRQTDNDNALTPFEKAESKLTLIVNELAACVGDSEAATRLRSDLTERQKVLVADLVQQQSQVIDEKFSAIDSGRPLENAVQKAPYKLAKFEELKSNATTVKGADHPYTKAMTVLVEAKKQEVIQEVKDYTQTLLDTKTPTDAEERQKLIDNLTQAKAFFADGAPGTGATHTPPAMSKRVAQRVGLAPVQTMDCVCQAKIDKLNAPEDPANRASMTHR